MIFPITKLPGYDYPHLEIGETLIIDAENVIPDDQNALAVYNSKNEILGLLSGRCLTKQRVIDILNKKPVIRIFAIFKNQILAEVPLK